MLPSTTVTFTFGEGWLYFLKILERSEIKDDYVDPGTESPENEITRLPILEKAIKPWR